MNLERYVYWIEGRVVSTSNYLMYIGHYCIDTKYLDDDARYGKWVDWINSNGNPDAKWKPVHPDEFPKEFKLQLLLLGV